MPPTGKNPADALLDALEGSPRALSAEDLAPRMAEHMGQEVSLELTQGVLALLRGDDLVECVDEDPQRTYRRLTRQARGGRLIRAEQLAMFDWSTLTTGDYIEGVGAVSSPSRCALLVRAMGAALADAVEAHAGAAVVAREDYKPSYR